MKRRLEKAAGPCAVPRRVAFRDSAITSLRRQVVRRSPPVELFTEAPAASAAAGPAASAEVEHSDIAGEQEEGPAEAEAPVEAVPEVAESTKPSPGAAPKRVFRQISCAS